MVVRGAKYPRKENEFYATPIETTRVLLDKVRFGPHVVDPACGDGAIIKVLKTYGYKAVGDDITTGFDFLTSPWRWPRHDLIMNPPFGIGGKTAMAFINRALTITAGCNDKFAVLLPVDFDSGITRRFLFGDCPAFALKLTLLNRIRWFNGQAGSLNHAWFIYDWKHIGAPTIAYAAQRYPGSETTKDMLLG